MKKFNYLRVCYKKELQIVTRSFDKLYLLVRLLRKKFLFSVQCEFRSIIQYSNTVESKKLVNSKLGPDD